MNKEKILFANIGWMTHYKGNTKKDQIVGGGSWSNDDKLLTFLQLKGNAMDMYSLLDGVQLVYILYTYMQINTR